MTAGLPGPFPGVRGGAQGAGALRTDADGKGAGREGTDPPAATRASRRESASL